MTSSACVRICRWNQFGPAGACVKQGSHQGCGVSPPSAPLPVEGNVAGAQASLRSHPGPVPFNPEAVHDFYKKREGCRDGLSEPERLFN